MSSIADYITKSLSEFYTGTAIPNAPKHTGRLPLSDEESKLTVPKAVLYAPEPSLIQYRHNETPLNIAFFCQDNIERLHNEIRDTVRQMVNADIDRQSDDDLLLIMRSYYLQYGQNNPARVAEELKDLNDRVVHFASNRIAVEVEAYRYYRKDIMDFPAPIANPINVKIYGTRTGELKSFF
jgi:Family of unknown function (DUF5761)